MMRIWLSSDRKANTRRIFEEICSKRIEGQILLVPEQFSHMAERQLCKIGGASINRYAEVLSFSRLASCVFATVGGSAETQTDAVGKLLMMSLAVEQVRSRLKLYGNCAEKPTFLLKLIDTLEEFQSFCITPQNLRETSLQLSGALAVKMEEFSLLMESYEAVCANLGQNPETRLTRLLYALDGSDFAEGKHIFIDGFSDFNGVEREIIAQLLCGGAEVTVSFHCDGLHTSSQQFAAARTAANELIRVASRQNTEVQVSSFGEVSDCALNCLKTCLFAGSNAPYPAETKQISFIQAGNANEECRIAAGEILELIQNGTRLREITIACADYENYRHVLESVLRRAKIPAYYAGDTDILQQSVIHMLLSALQAATEGMETEQVLSYLKSGFLSISRERCDRLENYVFLWNIQGKQWEQEWIKNPFGLGKEANKKSESLLQQLNEDRKKYIQPLIHLRDLLRTAKNTAQMLVAFEQFLEEIALAQQLDILAHKLQDENDLQKAQEYAQVYTIVCRLLEQMYGVLGNSVRTPEAFYQMFRTALSQCSIGTIPAALDRVNVGSLLSQRRSDSKYLFLLGANEGAFPSAQSNHTLLSDQERTSLMAHGIGLAPTSTSALERELAAIAGVLEVPQERIYLGANSGKESYYLLRAQRLFPNAPRYTDDTNLIIHSEEDYLNYLMSEHANNVQTAAKSERAAKLLTARQYQIGSLREETVRMLYGEVLTLSSTKIDTLASCRFSHFLRYGLKAKPREQVLIDGSLFGTFIHYVLEHTSKQIMIEGGFHAVSLNRAMAIAQAHMEQYLSQELADLWETEREEYLFRRNFAEVREVVTQLWKELSISSFEPKWFELNFGPDGEMPSIRIVGKKITAQLEGKVDRADIWRNDDKVYVRVVDYKSGTVACEFERILHGLGLQMLLYLFALRQSGAHLLHAPMECAGVLYFPAKMKKVSLDGKYDAKAEEKRLEVKRRVGLLLENEGVLWAMEPSETPNFLPKKNSFATSEQFELLEKFVMQTVGALADTLAEGNISANPYYLSEYANACGRCDYAEICRKKAKEEVLVQIKDICQFWQAVEGKCADG